MATADHSAPPDFRLISLAPVFSLWLAKFFLAIAVATLSVNAAASEILVSSNADRSAPQSLETQSLKDAVYIFVAGADDASQVRFYLDDNRIQTENRFPWDAAGTAPNGLAQPLDTRNFSDGSYILRVEIQPSEGPLETVEANLQIVNQPPPEEGSDASQLHLGWKESPAHSFSIMWFSPASSEASVKFRLTGEQAWQVATGGLNHQTADGHYLSVDVNGLLANAQYEFQVSLAPQIWSRSYRASTMPASGPQSFTAGFVADTGLKGRLDGLASGTQGVIDELQALDPDFIMLGGDYAYFDTDKRFGTLERSISAWFDQMAPIAHSKVMMPVYGNHEVLLGESFDVWSRYFATPEGWNARRMYSFDIGDVHFVAIYGLDEFQTLPQDALDWISSDLQQASLQGQRWLIPFFHAAPFSDGRNHPSASSLRAQLGPIFEAAGVKVVLTAHDQSYERTYPLTDVPNNNSPTSEKRHCYTLADGVSWLKVAPGGKLSNISKGFSPWASPTPPSWTVARNNSLHHFAYISVNSDGILDVDIHGLEATGAASLRIDRVRYTTQACEEEISALPSEMSFVLEPGASEQRGLAVTSGQEATNFRITQIPSWLSLSAVAGITPTELTVTADTKDLSYGLHRGVLEVASDTGTATWIPIALRVGASDYQLLVSSNAQRSAAVPLEGAVLQNDSYIFVSPESDITRVRFYLNDPEALGAVTKTENVAPFDLGGTASNDNALPFNTQSLADGAHTLGARVSLSGMPELLLNTSFQVANDAPRLSATPNSLAFRLTTPETVAEQSVLVQMTNGLTPAYTAQTNSAWLSVSPPDGTAPETLTVGINAAGIGLGSYSGEISLTAETGETESIVVSLEYAEPSSLSLKASTTPDRSSPFNLEGSVLSGDTYIFVPEEFGVTEVQFYLDDPERQNSPIQVEKRAPWDMAGTQSTAPRNAHPFDLSGLTGEHQVTAVVTVEQSTQVLHARFQVTP